MLRALCAATLVIAALPAAAQTPAPNAPAQVTTPSGQNSGAGIPGQPGNKSGPAVKPPSGTTGATMGSSDRQDPTRLQDPAKIPGATGSESGPAGKPGPGR
jgi:hypothetical protein